MISIRAAATELERQEALRLVTLDCHINTVRTMARCAVDVDAEITQSYRASLEKLAERLQRSQASEDLRLAQDDLKHSAIIYYEESARRLSRLREDFSDAARALSELVSSITTSSDDHDKLLEAELAELSRLATLSDPVDIRMQLQTAVQRLDDCIKSIRAENRFVIAQMRDEIRTLQERVSAAERSAGPHSAAAPAESPFTAEEITRSWIEQGRNFTALFVTLQSRYPRHGSPAPENAFASIQAELASNLPAGAKVGPWGADSICALAETDKNTLLAVSKIIPMLIANLNEPGKPPVTYGASGVVEYHGGENLSSFLRRVGGLLAALRMSA
jgi:uncharacterized coiled-coil protein SlyX